MTATVPKQCSSCGQGIFWARTDTGKHMPIDVDPDPDGNLFLIDSVPLPIARSMSRGGAYTPGAPRYKSHFATCEHAASHRRRGRSPKREVM